jgi:hypothetical protein
LKKVKDGFFVRSFNSNGHTHEMPKYTIPWSGLLPVFGITVFTIAMGSLVDWHYRFFRTEGKVRKKFPRHNSTHLNIYLCISLAEWPWIILMI